MIAVSDGDITYYSLERTIDAKRSRHVFEVAKGMIDLPSGPLAEADADVDIWRYCYYGERSYGANLSALQRGTLSVDRGRYMVYEDVVCWDRAVIPTRFLYMNWDESPFWVKQVRWERRMLSTLGWFVTYHMCRI